MSNLYCVKASIEDKQEKSGLRTIWQFNSITASSRHDAIINCKWTMKRLMGSIPDFKWSADLEWENNMAVN